MTIEIISIINLIHNFIDTVIHPIIELASSKLLLLLSNKTLH